MAVGPEKLALWPKLEAVAQTAFREACSEPNGVAARPARISKARKMLGKIHRS